MEIGKQFGEGHPRAGEPSSLALPKDVLKHMRRAHDELPDVQFRPREVETNDPGEGRVLSSRGLSHKEDRLTGLAHGGI